MAGGFWWRGSEAGDLWESAHLSCVLWLPEPRGAALLLVLWCCWFLGLFPRVWVPLCQIPNKKEQKPCGNAGGGAAPPHPTDRPGLRGRAQPRAPRWAEPSSSARDPKESSVGPQTRILGLQSRLPSWERALGSRGSPKLSLSSTFAPRPPVPRARGGLGLQPGVPSPGLVPGAAGCAGRAGNVLWGPWRANSLLPP